ncbi:hypothetical protein H6G97_15895 [Nostoc flagelliforme FACHB-838]|uniref:Uncharacterized protein n=1 Tax=Nostoc flagelliforme FACHB-838 TaxID=2692904 RepID=A0ABR8DQ18_9NOSO|nr:hypothetical protein [Nostoc flagelliforme]MBD2530981.1 hypothetical protein [Nostoc flagelliforme FACHB-838]
MALSISNLFDVGFYRAAHQDLAGFNDAQALSHFQSYGLRRSFILTADQFEFLPG